MLANNAHQTLIKLTNKNCKVILLPNIIDLFIDTNIGKLTKDCALTPEGRLWTNAKYPLWPFLDATQQDDLGRPIQVHPKNEETQLSYSLFVQQMFSTKRYSNFMEHIRGALQTEMVRRCRETEGNYPMMIADVFSVIKSDEMVQKFKSEFKVEVYNKIFYWCKSLTMEDNFGWLVSSVEEFFVLKGMHVTLASRQTKSTNRHSLLRWAVLKGTQYIKETLRRE